MRCVPPLALLLALSCEPAAVDAASRVPCAADGHLVVVDTKAHTLWLCSERRGVAYFKVALGRGGLDKTRQGDGRTPLGTYSLGPPRPSARFGTFIPIGYPTPDQSARGFTGKDVGIHGPERRASWLGSLSTWIDWTAGCVATGTDGEIAVVAAFVRERSPRVVLR
jgi:murein L,D-transpeptidase YafK